MLIFTICTTNQLANACVLGNSIKQFHADYEFIIGLVDKKNTIDTHFKSPYQIVDITELNIEGFGEMSKKYNWDELTANCKPFFAQHFLSKTDKLLYFDCTSVVYQPISFLSEILGQNNFILTPQLLHAGKHPDEKQTLNSGIYHSGMIGFKNSLEATKMLFWWANNTKNKGFRDLCKGLNADQLWLEHVPALYDKVYILKNESVNIGQWNLPERNAFKNNSSKEIDPTKVISFNFRGIKPSREYKNLLEPFQTSALKNTIPSFGLPNPKDRTLQKNIAKSIRNINSIFDWILDKIS